MQDTTIQPLTDGVTLLDESFLNENVRDPLRLMLKPPQAILDRIANQVTSVSPNWTAISWQRRLADTEDPATPIFACNSDFSDFESDTEGWNTVYGGTSYGTIVKSSTYAHSGSYSLKLTANGTTASAMAFGPALAASPGMPAEHIVWVLSPTARTIRVEARWHDAADAYLGQGYTDTAVTAGEWTKLSVSGVGPAPATTAHAHAWVSITGTPPAGTTLYIDESSFSVFTEPTKLYARTPGYYEIGTCVPADLSSGHTLLVAFRRNGNAAEIYGGDTACATNATAYAFGTVFATLIKMPTAGDYLEVLVKHNYTSSPPDARIAWNAPRVSFRRVRGI